MSVELFGYRLRPHQEQVLDYTGGYMAVSAVPGSGKTLTLSLLAGRLITEGRVGAEGEVLVVTVQNSAVEHIAGRIRHVLDRAGLPAVGFHVCTLHKLAADILRLRQDLAGVQDGFFIIDDGETGRLMHAAADVWIAEHHAWWHSYIASGESDPAPRVLERWRQETETLGREVTKLCKHLRLGPEEAAALLAATADTDDPAHDLAHMGVGLYGLYARYLQARSGLDFDDLIWRAITALDQDPTFTANLRQRWPYILEDEAQDSSPLQEQILQRLAGPGGNWIRVGDPNQSINSTFTAADPRYFRRFAERPDVARHPLPESGRCGQPIYALANHLVRWTLAEHAEAEIRAMAFEPQAIVPSPEGDGQPNPPADACRVYFAPQPFDDVASQGRRVAELAAGYILRHPEHSVAALCPATWQGDAVVEALRQQEQVTYVDLLRSTPQTRDVARVLHAVLRLLSEPTNARALAALYEALDKGEHLGAPATADKAILRRRLTALRSVAPQVALFPAASAAVADVWPAQLGLEAADHAALGAYAALAARWLRASALPVDQLILAVAQDLFASDQQESELAICHTIALSLAATAQMHPTWRLEHFAEELNQVARNRRVLAGLSLADAGYQEQKNCVVVTTLHKAKGLEWDTVYILSVDDLEFPATRDDAFRDELYFLPGRSPTIEARKFIEALAGSDFAAPAGATAVDAARLEVIAERLRLLYVGITRARRNLALYWAKANGSRQVRPAVALEELRRAQADGLTEE
jgi:DNA helicase-2/ATP-dependent DNA helicase PcrA